MGKAKLVRTEIPAGRGCPIWLPGWAEELTAFLSEGRNPSIWIKI